MTTEQHRSSYSYAFSIKEIAEFCWRTGDFQRNESTREYPTVTAKQGQQAHQRLQNQNKHQYENYQPEVSVRYSDWLEHPLGDYQLILRGRADAVWGNTNHRCIEEIKTTYASPDTLSEAQHQLHLAQAKLYAYLLCVDQNSSLEIPLQQSIQIQITYWQLDKEQQFERRYDFEQAQLTLFFQQTLEKFCQWLQLFHSHRLARQQLIDNLQFPFVKYRPGQKEFAATCYRTSRNKGTALTHAATGIGKSIASLFGTIKALADTPIEQIWYLTAKTSGKQAVDQALQILQQQGTSIKVLHLYNQSHSCFCDPKVSDELENNLAPCQWQQGYYDRKQEAMEALFVQTVIDLDTLKNVADCYQICPYQLVQELIPWVDIVIADFNYVFSHSVRNQNYLDSKGKKIALLVDESHNLANRCRDLYQCRLTQEQLHSVLSYLPTSNPILQKSIKSLQAQIKKLPKDTEVYPEGLFLQIAKLKTELDENQQLNSLLFTPDDLILIKAQLNQWLRLHKYCQQGLGSHQGKPFSLLKSHQDLQLICNNPSVVIDDLIQGFNSTVYFSGSLLPLHYFAQQFSDQEIATRLSYSSPFPSNRLQVILGPLAMDFNNRQKAIPLALSYIETLYQQKPGLYLVCVPSYQFLEQIKHAQENARQAMAWHFPVIFQQHDTPPQQARELETTLKQMRDGVAFVIMGGSFAEGVEWPRGVLNGVIILGNGMPSPSATQQRLKSYFDHSAANGFDFAYRFPAINRVIQTVGRIQRSDSDAGIVLLLDRRFRHSSYRQLLPNDWQIHHCDSPEQLALKSNEFWAAIEGADESHTKA
ncbi:MAG: PD-(D/E)XK nuclease family protein [Pseudomonadales bacterium]|nr:PD-(D/E)XK nuclease family protein [Pseudomonadales bacterium]